MALKQARDAAARGEVPVGAVVAINGHIIAAAGNETEATNDPTAHAELLALRRAAAALGTPRLPGATLTVTLEPCPLCATAAAYFRVEKIVFGAYDPKGGGIDHGPRIFATTPNLHRPDIIGGIRETECAALLQAFFESRR